MPPLSSLLRQQSPEDPGPSHDSLEVRQPYPSPHSTASIGFQQHIFHCLLSNIFLQLPRHPLQTSHCDLPILTTRAREQPECILHLPLLTLLTLAAQLERRNSNEVRIGYFSRVFRIGGI